MFFPPLRGRLAVLAASLLLAVHVPGCTALRAWGMAVDDDDVETTRSAGGDAKTTDREASTVAARAPTSVTSLQATSSSHHAQSSTLPSKRKQDASFDATKQWTPQNLALFRNSTSQAPSSSADQNIVEAAVSGAHAAIMSRLQDPSISAHSPKTFSSNAERNSNFANQDSSPDPNLMRVKQLHRGQLAGFELMDGFDDRWLDHVHRLETDGIPKTGFLMVMEPKELAQRHMGRDPALNAKFTGAVVITGIMLIMVIIYACIQSSKPSEYDPQPHHGTKDCLDRQEESWNSAVGPNLQPKYHHLVQ